MRDICRFLRIDIQAPASFPISLIRNTDETITLLARMARLVGRTHWRPPRPDAPTKAGVTRWDKRFPAGPVRAFDLIESCFDESRVS
jgi:hypothetical protein